MAQPIDPADPVALVAVSPRLPRRKTQRRGRRRQSVANWGDGASAIRASYRVHGLR